jgi:holo-[acyl-carrier protein] synthase
VAKRSSPPFTVGLDLVDLPRFRAALARHGEGLRRRVFTPAEWRYAATRADRDAVLAARFAVKEAVFKALGTGWGRGVAWRDVSLEGGGRTEPVLRLAGRTRAIAKALGVEIRVSLSHAGESASAVAIAFPAGR